MRVFTSGSRGSYETVPAEREITFRDLLTHTAGLTYGMMHANMVDAMYRDNDVDFQTSARSLAEVVETAASLPLLAQPGREWNYSIATDVLGHLVAIISGQDFAEFLQERVIAPLGMVDTGFHVPAGKLDRFAANYRKGEDGRPP
jgi:CubicO group peptidase (beta-lactamase class C family)